MVWFWIYSLLNARGARIGINWQAPGIYIPMMVYPYVFGMLLLVILPFTFNVKTRNFYPLLLLYLITSIFMFAVYYIFPVKIIRRDYGGPLFADYLMRLIIGLDDPGNCFPSNHCAVATLGYIGMRISKAQGWIKTVTLFLTLLVCLSTVLVGQHYWIDIPSGIALAVTTYLIFKRFLNISEV